MKRKKVSAVCLACFIVVFSLCACQRERGSEKAKIYVGVTYYDQSDTFLGELLDSFKEKLETAVGDECEVVVTVKDASGSQRIQNDQVRELIHGGCNVLCVNLVDRTDPSEIIDFARSCNVPIIFFNREPVEEDMRQWDQIYYVGADAQQSGVMQGELAASAIQENEDIDKNKDGKIQYVVLEGEPGHQDAIIRTESAVDTMKEQGIELEKLGCGIANWNRAQAQNRMLQMISRYQGQIELVLANNDDMALGAVDAYRKLNYTESELPVFFGIDGTQVGLEAVRDSVLTGTVYNDKEGQAEVMAKIAAALVTGKGMEDLTFEKGNYIYLSYSKITSKNVGKYLNDR